MSDSWDDLDDSGTGALDLSSGGAGTQASGAYGGGAGGLAIGGDDDPFADEVPEGSLELDVPAHHLGAPQPPRSNPSFPAARPQSQPSVPQQPVARSSGPDLAAPLLPPGGDADADTARPRSSPDFPAPEAPPPAPPPRPVDKAAAMIARFPTPPEKVWETPAYAVRVLWRQFELKQDLASLRKKRSPDVPLYERALRTHDPKAFAVGLAITCAALAVASFLFFLPVILRFLRAPD